MIDTLAELVNFAGALVALLVPVALAVLALYCAFFSSAAAGRRARRRYEADARRARRRYEVTMSDRARRISEMAARVRDRA